MYVMLGKCLVPNKLISFLHSDSPYIYENCLGLWELGAVSPVMVNYTIVYLHFLFS